MKKSINLLLVLVIALLLSSCGEKNVVLNEIYTGSEYMTIEDAKQYILEMLGPNADLYEIDESEKQVRFTLKEDNNETDWLNLSVSFTDGTNFTLPCTYSNVNALGWKSEENVNNDWVSGEFACCNNQGERIFLTRAVDSNDKNIKIKDSTIIGLRIPCGDFAKKDNYVQICNSHPEFSYMGINRESSPEDAVGTIGCPNIIEHDGVNMYFEYNSYDYSLEEKTTVEISWLTMEDGPKIMRDVEITRLYMSWLIK